MINRADITVSTDKSKLDINVIHGFLSESYWAKGRTQEQVKQSIENAICFGIYLKNNQIGFARVLSDKVAFAYLMDVFILEKYRGNGFSQALLTAIFNNQELKNVSKWFLATRDAHGLYRKFGFREVARPERLMEKVAHSA
jgi:N-acetylglutamate synthase-like GNAT family acetyltransferase